MSTTDNQKDCIIPLKQTYEDERGFIQTLLSLEEPLISSMLLVKSHKGSIRANHYHKTDWHYCYVISGSIEYYNRPAKSESKPLKKLVEAGQVLYTPAMVEHAFVFPEDTVFLVLSGGTRSQEDYESDLERVKLI